MATGTESHAISVMIDHRPSDKLTVATFEWPSQPPQDSYTIDVSSSISVEFDGHFPIRPAHLNWYDTEEIGGDTYLSQFFGDEFTEAMRAANTIGYAGIKLTLSLGNRIALAELQVHSPSTSPLLRKACSALLGELMQKKEETGGEAA